MLINATTGNDPMRQERVANITFFKCSQTGHYRKDYPNSARTSPVPDQNLSMPSYSLPTTVT